MLREALTETKIKQLKPRTKPYKASDGTVGGMHVAVSTAGGKVFCLAYRFDGMWCLLRLGGSWACVVPVNEPGVLSAALRIWRMNCLWPASSGHAG